MSLRSRKSSTRQLFGFSVSESTQSNEKENAQSGNEQETKAHTEASSAPDQTDASMSEEGTVQGSALSGTVKRRRRGAKRIAFSDSDSDSDLESDLSRDDLVKLVAKKDKLLGTKQEELEKMKDKVLRTLAEMENVKERTTRESENAKKFATKVVRFCLRFAHTSFALGNIGVCFCLNYAAEFCKEPFGCSG